MNECAARAEAQAPFCEKQSASLTSPCGADNARGLAAGSWNRASRAALPAELPRAQLETPPAQWQFAAVLAAR